MNLGKLFKDYPILWAIVGVIAVFFVFNMGSNSGDTPPLPTGEPPAPTATLAPGETPLPTPTATSAPPAATASATPYPPPTEQQRIVNPSFEGEYSVVEYPLYDGTLLSNTEIKTPGGWLPYYYNAPYTPEETGLKIPEFTYADRQMAAPHSEGGRVHSGERAMKWFCTYAPCIGGVYQTIQTIPGELCTVEAWVQTWFSNDAGPASESATSDERRASIWRIKVNLVGDVFAFATENLRSWEFGYGSGHYDYYARIYYEFQANSRLTTIFIENERSQSAWHNDSFLDDVTVRCAMPSSFFPDAHANRGLH